MIFAILKLTFYITRMLRRKIEIKLIDALDTFPVVALVGGRQVGKTTLAKMVRATRPNACVHLDLERPSDLAKIQSPEAYLELHQDKLVILDEIQRVPELFAVLRALVDADRRNGRFLVLGSASPALIRQSSESLAGRIRYIELPPLVLGEIDPTPENIHRLWVRGGYPDSFLAKSEHRSREWRDAFVNTYLERDIPSLGIRIPATMLNRFWRMLGHSHGQLWNAHKIAGSLGVTQPTANHYLDVLEDTFVARQLRPYHTNLKKRLVKTPKVYLRDSGLLHALLQIQDLEDLLGHPSAGASWEGWVIEQILALAPDTWRPWFYRTSGGAEIDLLLERPGRQGPLAFEIKRSSAPKPSRGFWSALRDLNVTQGYVVCPCEESFPLGEGVFTMPLSTLPGMLNSLE
jgi:hypothetical protein